MGSNDKEHVAPGDDTEKLNNLKIKNLSYDMAVRGEIRKDVFQYYRSSRETAFNTMSACCTLPRGWIPIACMKAFETDLSLISLYITPSESSNQFGSDERVSSSDSASTAPDTRSRRPRNSHPTLSVSYAENQ